MNLKSGKSLEDMRRILKNPNITKYNKLRNAHVVFGCENSEVYRNDIFYFFQIVELMFMNMYDMYCSGPWRFVCRVSSALGSPAANGLSLLTKNGTNRLNYCTLKALCQIRFLLC